jgi:predicted ferric reductase
LKKRAVEIYIEGPYGSPKINFDGDYKVFLFISGGIGITPLQSMYNNLIYQEAKGRDIRKVPIRYPPL